MTLVQNAELTSVVIIYLSRSSRSAADERRSSQHLSLRAAPQVQVTTSHSFSPSDKRVMISPTGAKSRSLWFSLAFSQTVSPKGKTGDVRPSLLLYQKTFNWFKIYLHLGIWVCQALAPVFSIGNTGKWLQKWNWRTVLNSSVFSLYPQRPSFWRIPWEETQPLHLPVFPFESQTLQHPRPPKQLLLSVFQLRRHMETLTLPVGNTLNSFS